MKRILTSLGGVFLPLLVLACLLTPSRASAALPECATYVEGKTFCYFEVPGSWVPMVWAWNGGTNFYQTWPGSAADLTLVGTNGSNSIYRWVSPKGSSPKPEAVICSTNNGNTKLTDGNITWVDGGYFTSSGLAGTVTASGPVEPDPVDPDGKITVYFDNSKTKWNPIAIHYWGAENTTWPGNPVTEIVKGNVYKYVLPAGTIGHIFNNNDKGAQTENLTPTNGYIYSKTKDAKGVAYNPDTYVEEAGGTVNPDPDPDYSSWYVNVNYENNNWADNGVKPTDGISKHSGLAIGNKGVKIKVWDGSNDHYYGSGTVKAGDWVTLQSTDGSTSATIEGAAAGDTFDVEFNCANNKVKFTKVGGSVIVTPEYTYQLHGQITGVSDWASSDMEYDGTNWSITGNFVSGEFGIKKNKDGNQQAWYSYSALGTPQDNCTTGEGGNIKLTDKGNYTITFLTATSKITVKRNGDYVQPVIPELEPTGTLPVIYINCDEELNGQRIDDYNLRDKDYRIGSYWFDAKGLEGFDNVGSEDAPLALSIKARGNFTRTAFSKKPFKLKLDKKQALAGLTKSKHFALLNHSDDDVAFLRNYIGFYLGRLMYAQDSRMWCPREVPVEVVINGDYRGIYFLTESIRVGDDRVMITELADGETDTDLLSGGYLIELDNYKDSNTIIVNQNQGGKNDVWVTPNTPEILSSEQASFLTDQFATMHKLVKDNSDELWKYMDIDAAARYYLIMEVCSHFEAYHGSTYMYRDYGADQKWTFSPLWDMGNAFNTDKVDWLWNCGGFGNTWITDMVNNTKFMDKVKANWKWFWGTQVNDLYTSIDNYVDLITEACKQDRKRWKDVPLPDMYQDAYHPGVNTVPTAIADNSNTAVRAKVAIDRLKNKIEWLKQNWGEPDANATMPPLATDIPAATLPAWMDPTVPTPTVYLYDDQSWGQTPNIYLYTKNADNTETNNGWPGAVMTLLPEGTVVNGYTSTASKPMYKFVVSRLYASGNVMFSSGGGRFPAEGSAGLPLGGGNYGKDMFYRTGANSTSGWVEAELPKLPLPSGSLPVINITVNEELGMYISDGLSSPDMKAASAYVTGAGDVANLGSESAPLPLGITKYGDDSSVAPIEKCAYLVKFDKKQTFGSIPKSKHYLLTPFNEDAADHYINNLLGHELSKQLGMYWTPSILPVELTVNGDYRGLYFLVENIRPAAERICQYDYGDYLDAVFHGTVDTEKMDAWSNLIMKISQQYGDYSAGGESMTVMNLNSAIAHLSDPLCADEEWAHASSHNSGISSLSGLLFKALNYQAEHPDEYYDLYHGAIDLESATKYFLIQELMDDHMGLKANTIATYTTHTDTGVEVDDPKFKFGPVWDFTGAYGSNGNKTAFLSDACGAGMAKALYSNNHFMSAMMSLFKEFAGLSAEPQGAPRRAAGTFAPGSGLATAWSNVQNTYNSYAPALANDAERWAGDSDVNTPDTEENALDNVKANLMNAYDFLATRADDIITSVTGVASDADAPVQYFDVTGRRVFNPEPGTVLIVKKGTAVSKLIAR